MKLSGTKKGIGNMIGLSKFTFILLILSFLVSEASSQVTDTIANWDGINVEWTVSGPESALSAPISRPA